MTKGIVLFAFGRRGYAYMAYNIAMSIKYYNKNIPITLYIDTKLLPYIEHQLDFFDDVLTLPSNVIYKDKVGIDPASVKVNVPMFLPYDENLYLDVDGIALKDLQPLIDSLSKTKGSYLTQVIDSGNYDKNIEYAIWAKKEKVWEFFELNNRSIYPSVQTSFAYFKKGVELDKFYAELKRFYDKGFSRSDIKQRWGGTLPDEMFYSGTCAFIGTDPDCKLNPIFFGNKGNIKEKQEVLDDYYILAIYGNGRGNTLTKRKWFELYDEKLLEYHNHFGVDFFYNSKVVMVDKHANF